MSDEPVWHADELAEAAAAALRSRADELRAEQAVRGLDALPEVSLHPLLAAGFREAGFGVHPEHPYPGEAERRPRHAERERCDLVLTAPGAALLLDPVRELRETDKAAGTLFGPMVAAGRGPGPGAATPPEHAFWIEVKAVGQFTYCAGVPGPNRSYAAELTGGPAEDAIKLEWDARVKHCGLLAVLFTADEATADHDFAIAVHRMLDRGIPVGAPARRRFAVPNLIGNTVCTVVIVPLRKG